MIAYRIQIYHYTVEIRKVQKCNTFIKFIDIEYKNIIIVIKY